MFKNSQIFLEGRWQYSFLEYCWELNYIVLYFTCTFLDNFTNFSKGLKKRS